MKVSCIKLLHVIVQKSFNVDMHVNYVLSVCSQPYFLPRNGSLSATNILVVVVVLLLLLLFLAIRLTIP